MNFLFYVGIIVPTTITTTLFVIFIYCWFLQKARKEVLTKKYDPHGKMRRLGLSMRPPGPPRFFLMDEVLMSEIGEDNIAYDVSRSPSTEQTGRGRPMYKTFHDSGISAGLSPSQESEPRHSLVFKSFPNSGVSRPGLSPCHGSVHPARGGCYIDGVHPPQSENLYEDQVDVQAQQPPFFQGLVQASVHSPHGVCYGDDTNHQPSQTNYNFPRTHPNSCLFNVCPPTLTSLGLAPQIVPSLAEPSPRHQLATSYNFPESRDQQFHYKNGQLFYMSNQISPNIERQQANNTPACSFSNKGCLLSPSRNVTSQTPSEPDLERYLSDFSLSSKPEIHSHRDSGIMDTVQSLVPLERPDSQASHSSTTDSEDSGFRSSYCAAHPNTVLNKQGNPLLKPLRKSRNIRSSKVSKNSKRNEHRPIKPSSLITLSPRHLAQNTNRTLLGNLPTRNHRQPFTLSNGLYRNRNSSTKVVSHEAQMPASTTTLGGAASFLNVEPRVKGVQSSPSRDLRDSQPGIDKESIVKQNTDIGDRNSHLSWVYMQNLNQACHGPPSEGPGLGQCSHEKVYGQSVV